MRHPTGRRRRSSRTREIDLERYRSFIPDWDRFADTITRVEPTVLRVRTGRISPEELKARLDAQGSPSLSAEKLFTFSNNSTL